MSPLLTDEQSPGQGFGLPEQDNQDALDQARLRAALTFDSTGPFSGSIIGFPSVTPRAKFRAFGGDESTLTGQDFQASPTDPTTRALYKLQPNERQQLLSETGYPQSFIDQIERGYQDIGRQPYISRDPLGPASDVLSGFYHGARAAFAPVESRVFHPTTDYLQAEATDRAIRERQQRGIPQGGFGLSGGIAGGLAAGLVGAPVDPSGNDVLDAAALFPFSSQAIGAGRGLSAAISGARLAVGAKLDAFTVQAERQALNVPRIAGAAPPQVFAPTPAEAAIGLRGFALGDEELSRTQRLANLGRRAFRQPQDSGYVTPAMEYLEAQNQRIDSDAVQISQRYGQAARQVFHINNKGEVTDVAGLVPGFKNGATIQDIAERMPLFQEHLSPDQLKWFDSAKEELAPYEKAWREARPTLGRRPSIMEGGFYIPRGNALEEGMQDAPKVTAGRRGPPGSGIPGAAKSATFDSMAEGIQKGYEYIPFEQAVAAYVKGSSRDALNNQLVTALRAVVNPETGEPFAKSFRPGEMARHYGEIALPGMETIATVPVLGKAPIYVRWTVGFPDPIANAANKALRESQFDSPTAQAVTNLMRGVRATGDVSGIGVQSLLGVGGDRKAWVKAVGVSLRSLVDRDAYGALLNAENERAARDGLLSTKQWANFGLRQGGVENELLLGRGAGSIPNKIPLVRQSNRAFGVVTDVLRLKWANNEIERELVKGRTLQEIIDSGDAESIARIINRATGYSQKRVASHLGDVLLFAPRYMQARMETIVTAVAKGGIEGRIARRSMLQLVGGATMLTYLANEAQGKETDFNPIKNGQWNGDFLRIDYGGRKWSLLGPWDSMARLMVGLPVAVARGNAKDAFRSFQSVSSPAASMLLDNVFNETFQGKKVHQDKESFAKWAASQFQPFSWNNQLPASLGGNRTGGSPSQDILNLAGDVMGFKGTPLSQTNDLNTWLREHPVDAQGQLTTPEKAITSWSDLAPGGRGFLVTRSPAIQSIYARHAREVDPYQGERQTQQASFQMQTASDKALLSGEKDAFAWRQDMHRSEADAAVRREGKTFPEASTPEGKALEGYYQLAKQFERGQDFDAAGFADAADRYLGSLPKAQSDYIFANLHPRATDLQKEYYAFQQTAQKVGWYTAYRNSEPWAKLSKATQDAYEKYDKARAVGGSRAAVDFIANYGTNAQAWKDVFGGIDKLNDEEQARLRVTNPTIEKGRVLFYDNVPTTLAGVAAKAKDLTGERQLGALVDSGKWIDAPTLGLFKASGVRDLADLASRSPAEIRGMPAADASFWIRQAKAVLEWKAA